MARLEDRVTLVTGAASGIGAASALRFAQEGAIVVGFDLEERGDEVWDEATRVARESLFVEGDIRDERALTNLVERTLGQFGRLDVLMNSAGVPGGGPVHMVPTGEWDRVIDINLKGTFLACRAALPVMLEQRSGSIINVASVEGIEGFEGGSAYNASKGGVMLLTRNLAMDYGRRGIRSNVICPGFIQTPMQDQTFGMEGLRSRVDAIREASQLGRFGQPVEVANAALFLASQESSFITGHALVVDGGFTTGHRFGLGELMGLA